MKTIFLISLFFIFLIGCNDKNINNSDNIDDNDSSNLNIIFFGDSLTQNFEESNSSYPDLIEKNLDINAFNLGLGGTSMSTHPSSSFNAFSFHMLSKAITNNNYTKQEESLNGEEIPGYFVDKLQELKSLNWEEIDIVVVAYGANDWGKPIDNEDNEYDVNSFKGAGRTSIETLLVKYPHLKFLFVPSIYRFWPDYENVDSDTSTNSLGLNPVDYSDAMIELSKEYKFPYVDSYYGLGINQINREYYFDLPDGTHPNQEGVNALAKLISNAIETYY